MPHQSLGQLLALTLAQHSPAHISATTPAGTHLHWHSEGVLEITPAQAAPDAMALVLSAGIHGNETAPIELFDRLLQAIAMDACVPQVRLLAILGNLPAIRAGVRYCKHDINRLFNGHHQGVAGHEAARAAELEQLVLAFFQCRHTVRAAALRHAHSPPRLPYSTVCALPRDVGTHAPTT